MANSFPAIFSSIGSIAMVAGIGIAMGGNANAAAARFQIHVSLSPAPIVQSSATGIGLQAQLTARRGNQSGGGYSLLARVTTPQVCSDDTIFIDGFDP